MSIEDIVEPLWAVFITVLAILALAMVSGIVVLLWKDILQ